MTHGVYSLQYDLALNGSDCYIGQMVRSHDPAATWDHNIDGDYKTSQWGWETIDAHYNTSMVYFIVMFGNNDIHNNINGTVTGQNLLRIYQYVKANGSIPVIVMHPLENPVAWGDSSSNITQTENLLASYGVPYVKMYDALDSQANNSAMDAYNGTYTMDGAHPNHNGHALMGEYLWMHYLSPAIPTSTSTPTPAVTPEPTPSSSSVQINGDWNGDNKTFFCLWIPGNMGFYRQNPLFYGFWFPFACH